MKCPHCAVSVHPDWHNDSISKYSSQNSGFPESTMWCVRTMVCPNCHKDVLELGRMGKLQDGGLVEPRHWTQIYPRGANRSPVPPDAPADIAADYKEAAMVLPLSPKASAALSRRCLQTMLRQAGYPRYDLSKQIRRNRYNEGAANKHSYDRRRNPTVW
jgi:hypothetical protein